MAQKAVFGEMSFTNSIPGLDGTAYSVSLTKGSDNATVDASGNLVGRFYDEVNGIRTYRYHTAVAVNKNNIPLLLAGMMDGNMTAGEGTYSIHATGDNCTVLVVGSTVYITSIANIHDGDASTSEEIDYEAMRSMREAVAHILINCEGKAEATLDYRVQLTHLPNSNVTFLCDNQQIDRAWTEKSGWIGGANGAFPQETIPFRAIHNNQELQITALTPQTVDGARYDEDDCPVKFSDPQLGDTGASVCLTDYTASLDGSKSVKVRFGMTALCNGITYEGFADFILSLSVDNAVYQLKPEATQVNGVWDEDGYEYTPAFLAFPTVLRTSDIDELIELSVPELGGYDLIPQYCINATEWHLYTGGISIADITETVAFRVLKDGIVRDVETIAVLRDGRNGESAFTIDLENEFDTIPTKLSDNGTVVLDYDNGGYYESAVRAFYGIQRNSESLDGEKFFYSATLFKDKNIIVRSALPYNSQLYKDLTIDKTFAFFIIGITIVLCIILYQIAHRLAETERQKVESEKQQLKRQLTQNAAHELKTPTASISAYLETLLADEGTLTDENRRHFLERSYAQCQRMTNILSDMSALAKMDAVQQVKEPMRIDVRELLDGIAEDVRLALEKAKMSLLINVENITILGDRSLVYSIFRNLIDNAIAYAGEGKEIRISATQLTAETAEFFVSDNGVGVPKEHLSHLCERFYRIDKGRSRKLGGTGLGLAIVKNAILLHDGEIDLMQTPGGGLTIRFTLPCA